MTVTFLLQDRGRVYGAERSVLDLAVALRSRGIDATLLLIRERRLGEIPADVRQAAADAAVPATEIPVAGRLSWGLVRAIRAAAGTGILHSTGDKAAFHAMLARASRRGPVHVSTVHGWLDRPDPKERMLAGLGAFALRRADAVIALSRFYHERLAGAGVPAERLHVIRPGFDAKAPGDWPPPPDGPFTVVLPARLSEEKNPGLLVRAVARARDLGCPVRAVIAGDGRLRARLLADIRSAGLEGQVEVPGHLARRAWLARAHAVALCSRIENQPVVVLEAMAAARPVVATRVGGIPELVEEGATGLLVPDDDPHALAEALIRLARDPAFRARLGTTARARVETLYTPAAMVDAHLALYERLANQA